MSNSAVSSARFRNYSLDFSSKEEAGRLLLQMVKYQRRVFLNLSTGPNSDNGIDLQLGSSRGNGYQAARSHVVTYMIGECSMLFKFHPYVEDVRYATIPFAHGWLIVLMPADDTLCNHSLMMPHDVLKPHGYRTHLYLRRYVSTGMVRR